MKQIRFSNFILLVFFLLLFSCQTKPQDFVPLSYNELDARENEIEEIRKDFALLPLKSLWRSALLVQTMEAFPESHQAICDELFQESRELVINLLEKKIEEKNVLEAKKLYLSLRNLSLDYVQKYEKVLKDLENNFFQNFVQTFNLKESLSQNTSAENNVHDSEKTASFSQINLISPAKFSEYLKGLVTVWVDRGFSVQQGIGFPDRVIGSGFFIDTEGHLITNYHVIESEVDTSYKGYSRTYIKLFDDIETRYPARVIGYDKALDLALLKTEAPVPYSFNLGSSEGLEVGDRIFAMGSPLGLENTITSGIVSSKNRMLSTIASVMQIDAAVNPGNSGGPIIDANGLVQAIVFAGVQEFEGLNFAIPVEQLKKNLLSLYAGEVKHSYTGFYAKTKRDLPQDDSMGIEVHYVMRNSTAQKGFLEKGDIIQAVNDIPIRNVEDYQNAMLSILPDTIIKVSGIQQDKSEFEKYLYTQERPNMPLYEVYKREPIADFFLPSFGMKLKRISVYNKNKYEIESIIKGSIADENGFSLQDPVEVKKIQLLEKDTIVYVEIYTRKRNKAYFEVNMALAASMDSPYFF